MIATKYIFFAIFSTSMNLLAQFLTFSLLDYSFIIYIAILNNCSRFSSEIFFG